MSTSERAVAGEPAEATPAITEAARAASKIAGVTAPTLMAQVARESGFNADARNPASSAAGPAQFLEATWLEMIQRHGAAYGLAAAASKIETINGRLDIADAALKSKILDLRKDPALALAMAGRYLAAIETDLAKLLGRPASELEVRLGYLLGAGGAALLLKAARATPRRPAPAVLPEAAKANPSLFQDAEGRPLSVAACLDAIRRSLRAERDDWAARLDSTPEPETIGDALGAATAG